MANGDYRQSHDQNFKNLILDYPRQSLAFFAREEAPDPGDNVRILPLRQEQLQERLGSRQRELDLPVLVEWEDGRREALLFVLEEETDPHRFSLHRLAHYCLDLAELYHTDRVVPVVIFLRPAGDTPPLLVLGSERRNYLVFGYLSCALSDMPFEAWEESDTVVARVNLVNMRTRPEERVRAYVQAVRGLMALEPDETRRAKYVEFIDMYAQLGDNELRQYAREYPEENRAMAGIVQRAREQGIEQGIEQGLQQGRLAGERAVLERLLRHRFGPLSAELHQRLEQASSAELETWAERILDADTLEAVFH